LTLTVQFARAVDYPAAATVYNSQNDPDFHTDAERMLRADRRSADRDPYFRRVTAEVEGEVVGTGYIRSNWAGVVQPGRYWVGLFVSPQWRGRGVDLRMLRYSLTGMDVEVRELACCLREDFIEAAGFLQDFAFQERFRSWGAHLDLRTFDPARFEATITRLERSGFRFLSYDNLQSAESDIKLLELKREIDRDVLSFEPIVPSGSVDILGEEYVGSGLIVALNEDGEFVGMASLRRTSTDGGLSCGLTGVRREYRGRGIATALKVRSLDVAKAMGMTEIGTGGGGANSPMKRVNERLGFKVEPAWVTFISAR
jgi:mycothiol synthase